MSFMGGTYRRIELDPPHDRVSVFVEVRDIPQTPRNREEQKIDCKRKSAIVRTTSGSRLHWLCAQFTNVVILVATTSIN